MLRIDRQMPTGGRSSGYQRPQSANGFRAAAHRFTVAQYHEMIKRGILGENDRVELLDGWIINKMTHNPPHDATISVVKEEVEPALPRGWMLRIQSAITLPASEPEPDLAVVKGPARRYVKTHPLPKDIGMLIEVAETSLEEDREFKGPLYALAGVPRYWVVNLIDRQVEVYSQPRGGRLPGYQHRLDYREGDQVPLLIAGRKLKLIAVRDLLP
jgi:Uma2 family endonuclease